MKLVDAERGASVRRNLARWKRTILLIHLVWLLAAVGVAAATIAYGVRHHLSERRMEALGSACGMGMTITLAFIWGTILIAADRRGRRRTG